MISLTHNRIKTRYNVDCGDAIINFEYDNVVYKLSKKCVLTCTNIYSGGNSYILYMPFEQIYKVDLNRWIEDKGKRIEQLNVKFTDMISKLQNLIDNYNFGLDGPVYNENIL
uniref:Uncharacterized protein n=1 Tax=viral metagenome TaxID=1070528 RepID=A0A6C0JUM8_9ZZZZ